MANVRCTVEDVARAAGVSLMTVSRAMNGKPGLGAATRRRVLETAARLGYRPSRVARALASRKTSAIGIILPDMANPYFAILAKGASDIARTADKSLFIMNTDEDPDLEFSALASLHSDGIAGIILAGSRLPKARLLDAISPFAAAVLINRDCPGSRAGNVGIDYKKGASDAIVWLASSGRKRIALLAGPRIATSARQRLAGYRDGLDRSGLVFEPLLVEGCIPNFDGGMAATRALLGRSPRIDAILAYNDLAAIGAMRAVRSCGRSVPSDIAVMGTDDIPIAELVAPSLSTLHADISLLGATAMTMLLALEENREIPDYPPQIPYLVIREST